METKTEWFNQYGHFTGEFPAECVSDCSADGSVKDELDRWVVRLGFDVPQRQAAWWLKYFGAWTAEELADHDANVRRVLWIACCGIKEHGEWFGLVH